MSARKLEMTPHLFAELARLRDGLSISRKSATILAHLGFVFIREVRIYEQGANRKLFQRSITRAGREALARREREELAR